MIPFLIWALMLGIVGSELANQPSRAPSVVIEKRQPIESSPAKERIYPEPMGGR